MSVEITKYPRPIKIQVGDKMGLVVGETTDGRFAAIDFGDAGDDVTKLKFLPMDRNAEVRKVQ